MFNCLTGKSCSRGMNCRSTLKLKVEIKIDPLSPSANEVRQSMNDDSHILFSSGNTVKAVGRFSLFSSQALKTID